MKRKPFTFTNILYNANILQEKLIKFDWFVVNDTNLITIGIEN